MPLPNPDTLRLHFVNCDHGDGIIVEFPDIDPQRASFGIVDTGRPGTAYRDRVADYLESLIGIRDMASHMIEFVCVTHPHEDHYGGLGPILDRFAPEGGGTHVIRQFWDCGFRTAAKTYNKHLDRVAADDRIVYARLAAGAEFEFGSVRVEVLAPSLDLRNRFDTFGVDRNNASIVLKVTYDRSIAILSGDAFFDSWGKVVEEFPRTTKITYFKDAKVERSEGPNQLNCQLLKVSHHGSKNGTSLEYLEKLTPGHFVVTCASASWYDANKPNWGHDWPHPLTVDAIKESKSNAQILASHDKGHIVYRLTGSSSIKAPSTFHTLPGTPNFAADLENALA